MKIGSKNPLPSQSPFPHSSQQTYSRARVSGQQGLQRDIRHPSSHLYHPHNLYHRDPLYGGWNTSLHSYPPDYGGGVKPDYYDYDYENDENERDSGDPYYDYNDDKAAYNVADYHYSLTNFGHDEENQTPKTVHLAAITSKNAPVTPTVLTYTTAAPNYVSPFPQSQTMPRHLTLKASDPTLHHSGVLLKENPVTPTVVTYTSTKPIYPLPHPASEIRIQNSPEKHSGVKSHHAVATPDKDTSVPDVLAYLTSKANYPSSSLKGQTRLRQQKQNLQRANSRYKAASPLHHHEMPRHKNVHEHPQTITTSSKYSLQEHRSKAIYDPKDYTTPATFSYETKSHSPSTPSYQDITNPSHVLFKENPTGRPLRSPKLTSVSHSLPVYENTYDLTNLEEKHLQQDTLYSHSEEVNPDLLDTVEETSANRETEDKSPKENFAPLKKPSITFYSSEETDPDPNIDGKTNHPINTHHTSTTERNLFNQHSNQYSYNPLSNLQGYYNHYWGNDNYRSYFTDPYAYSQNTFTGSRAYSGPNVPGAEDTTLASGNLLAARGQYFNPGIQSDTSAYHPQEILRQYYLDSYTYLANLRRNDSLAQIYKENPYTRRFMGVAPKFMSTTGPYPPKPRLSFDTVDDNITGLHVNKKHVHQADPTEFVSSVGGNIKDLTIQTSTQIPEHLTPVTHTALSMESFKSEETPTAAHLTTLMPFRAAEITTTYNPELNSVMSVLNSEQKGKPKHNRSISAAYSTVGPSSPKKSLLELYPFKRPDPSRYFSETSTTVKPLNVTPGNKPKNVNSVVSPTRVRNASPRPKPIRRRKPKIIPDNVGENKHRNITGGEHRRHPTLPRKYLARRQRPTSLPAKSTDESQDSESKPVTLNTQLSQEISKSKSTANVRNQRNKKLVKRRRRPSQARISLLNSTHNSPASHSSSLDSSTPYIPSTVTPTIGYLSSTENNLHGIPETLTSVQSPSPSTSDIPDKVYIASSNEMKHNPSSGVVSLEMLVEKPIPLLPTLASSSIDSTTNEEKNSPLPHHDLQHPVIPQTTLVPQGETSSHSPLPIPTGKKKRRPLSNPDTKGQEGSQKASNLEEVREYSLALYQHLQEQLKSRQLSTPRQRGRTKRRRVTRQTITPTEENVTEGGLNDMDIEDMLIQGMNFIPPVDPKQLRIALRELLQLASNYKKKGILYPKSSGYSYLPSDKDGNGFGESISKELVTPASEKERLQKEGNANIDASLSLEELNIDDDVEVNSYIITLPSSTPSTSSKQVAQEIPTAVDVSDDYVPPKQGEIDTLGRGTVKFQPSGRRRPFWGRRRRYKGYRHRCPDDETTTVTSQQPLVPPTIPSRPTIPELDFPDEPSSTITVIPTQETPTTSPRIPGAIPTTTSTTGIPSATPTTPPSSSSPIPGNDNKDDDYNYEDYNGNDYDDYYVNFGDSDNGVDPGLTSGGIPANNGAPPTNNLGPSGGNGGNVPKSLDKTPDEGSVIILVQPDENRETNGVQLFPKAFSQLKERRVSGSAIILVDSNDSRNNRNFERQFLSSKEGNAEGSAIILIDSDSNKSINERWRNIEISTSKEHVNSGSTIILVDPNSKKDSIPEEKSEKINQAGGSTIILVEPNKDNISSRENRPPSISRVSKETGNSAIILINPQDSSKTFSYKGAQSIEVENDGSVIILVEPNNDPSDSPPSNINTLNPTIKPLSSQLVAPAPSQSHVSLYANDLPPASISSVESLGNAQSHSARFESKGNLQGKQNEEEQSFVRSRTRRLRNEHQGNIIVLAGPDVEHTFKRSQGIREEPDTTSRESIRNFQEPTRRQRGGQSINSRNNWRQRNPRRRRKPSRFRDNVSGRNDFLLGLGRGRGPNSFRYRQNHSRENVRAGQDSSNIDYDTTDGRNPPRSDDSVGIRTEVSIQNQNREPRTRTRQLDQSSSDKRTEEPFQGSRDLTRGSRENFGETRTQSDIEERREFSGSREDQRSDRRYYGNGGFSWLNPRSEEVTITRDDESIPEKIREIRESIEAKARAWTNFGLQRTRPEFRRTRRPALG
ncbi:mucin-2-like [Macrobrachium rosenbergii]|uniref:mucin-2-like n=1 Tax=Macrobrachium rosenbergii TaxID=79674 RepID=UPI0034D6423F